MVRVTEWWPFWRVGRIDLREWQRVDEGGSARVWSIGGPIWGGLGLGARVCCEFCEAAMCMDAWRETERAERL